MPSKTIMGVSLIACTVGLVPFALIARSRQTKTPNRSPILFQDMYFQPKFKPQSENLMFADGRAMRQIPDHTVAVEDMEIQPEMMADSGPNRMVDGSADFSRLDETGYAEVMLGRKRPAGMSDGDFDALKPPTDAKVLVDLNQPFYVTEFPKEIRVTSDLLARGQDRFNIYCMPCHGMVGLGDGMVARRVDEIQHSVGDPTYQGAINGWVAPSNLVSKEIAAKPLGHFFNAITNGIRTMPRYDKQISVMDRWAIVAYVRALQVSQNTDGPKPLAMGDEKRK